MNVMTCVMLKVENANRFTTGDPIAVFDAADMRCSITWKSSALVVFEETGQARLEKIGILEPPQGAASRFGLVVVS